MKRFIPYIIILFILTLVSFVGYFNFKPKFSFPPNITIVKASGSYAYKNATNVFLTQFKAKATDQSSIYFQNELGKISFYTPASQSFGTLNSTNSPISNNNTIIYSDIFPQVDLRYTVSPDRLLEEFIIKDASTATQISRIEQRAKTATTYTQNDDGSISFFKKDQLVFTLPHPVMYEVGDTTKTSSGIVYEIAKVKNELVISKVITDEGKVWLADESRTYPIAIDLVIDNADTSANWVSSDTTFTPVTQESTIKAVGSTASVKISSTAETMTSTVDLMEYATDATAQSTYVGLDTNTVLATGGTITTSDSNKIHTFTSGSTLSVSEPGTVQSLIVAGGGGGGANCSEIRCSSGGGGAGGLLTPSSISLSATDYSVTVGIGGPIASNGGNSTFAGYTAIGGGAGAKGIGTGVVGNNGASGGSGGGEGGQENQWCGTLATGTAGQGYEGGRCNGYSGNVAGAGGGAGGAASWSTPGPGYASSITGSPVTYAAGGGVASATAGANNTGNGGGTLFGKSSLVTTTSAGGSGIVIVNYPSVTLQSYSESTIKTEGSYSLKGYGEQTTSLNKTLTRTVVSPLNLTSHSSVTFDIRASRTGSNIKIGLHDVGGTTTEVTPNITQADTFQTATVDLSGVSNANKDAIDKIIITVVNADAANTFYLDNMATHYLSIGDTITRTAAAVDLSSISHIGFWVYSPKVGVFSQIEFGENASNEQTKTIQINVANTWEFKTWDIIAVPAASKNAVTKFAFRILADTGGSPLYFDSIESLAVPSIPTIGTPAPLSDSSIRWNFTDTAYNELGFRVFDPNGVVNTLDLMDYTSTTTAQAAYITSFTSALGGTITNITNYRVHTFLTTDTLSFITGGNVEALLVGGGGNGVSNGGGGGGKVTTGTYSVANQTAYTVTVGNGGGGASSLGAIVSSVGGSDSVSGGIGGSSGNGYAGGANTQTVYAGGGGGGAGGVGQSSGTIWEPSTELTRPAGGNGGIGITSSINGIATGYGGGGGGRSLYYYPGIGQYGGGNGAYLGSSATSSTPNTGGGGGSGGTGASGIVIVRYPTPGLEAFSEATIKSDGSNSLKIVANQTTSLNQTLTRTIASPVNLSDNAYFSLDIRASRTGSNLKIGLHDAGGVTSEFTPNVTVADTFQNVTFDISGIINANKDAIDQIIITITNADAANTIYLDYLRGTVSGAKVTTCAGVNATYCDETGLSPNATYSRKVSAYNESGDSSGSATGTMYTMAAVPVAPTITDRTATSVKISVSKGTNPVGTQLAIYKVANSITCNGSGGVYLAANGSDNGSTAVWQTDVLWGTQTNTGLTTEKGYSFCVKAKNANGVETTFSAIGSRDKSFVPLTGDFTCDISTTPGDPTRINSDTFTNRYSDPTQAGHYIIALDNGATPNTATFVASSNCILSINANDTLATGSIKLTGGSIAIPDGAVIKLNQATYIKDADADGYSADGKIYLTGGAGYRRKNLATTLISGQTDCNDNVIGTVGATPLYQDLDGDGYGNLNVAINACATAGYVTNKLDCGDNPAAGGANARPNQTSGFTTTYTNVNNAPSYDWNCSSNGGTGTYFGTEYYASASTPTYVDGDSCNAMEVCRNKCTASTTYNLTTTQVACGGTGNARGTLVNYNSYNPWCTGCFCSGATSGYPIAASGTQACN